MELNQLNFFYKEDISEMTLREIRDYIKTRDKIKESFIKKLKKDSRKTTTELALKCLKKNDDFKKEKERIENIKRTEKNLQDKGYELIAGVDEAGKGALAGPVTAAAVIFPKNTEVLEITDSKKLSFKKRESLYKKIVDEALAIGVGMVSAQKIDSMGISTANRLAMKKACDQLDPEPDFVIIDSVKIDGLGFLHMSITRGDLNCYSIGAASIIAKVTRDRLMIKLDKKYPEYDFKHNMGYGTKNHKEAVNTHGYSEIHRKSFKFHQIQGEKLDFKCIND